MKQRSAPRTSCSSTLSVLLSMGLFVLWGQVLYHPDESQLLTTGAPPPRTPPARARTQAGAGCMGAPGGCRAVAVEPLRLEPRSCAGRIRVEPAARPRTRLWLARQSESRGPITGRRACWRHVTRVCGAVPDCRRPAGRQRPARQCRHHSSDGTIQVPAPFMCRHHSCAGTIQVPAPFKCRHHSSAGTLIAGGRPVQAEPRHVLVSFELC